MTKKKLKRFKHSTFDTSKFLLLFVSFVEGAALMVTEILGAKIMAPVFGTSLYVWSSTLGVSLGALALGYYIGGILSKKYPGYKTLFYILVVASVLTVVMPYWASKVMSITNTLDVRTGSLVSLVAYLMLPMMLMATTSPLIIQLLNKSLSQAGEISGKIYAISTVGGIMATFLSGLYLIPFLGIRNSALITGVVLLISVLVYFIYQWNNQKSIFIPHQAVIKTRLKKAKLKTAIGIALPLLLIISFIEGGSVMIIEIIGAKILAMYYGSSLIIWSEVLGVTLLALAVGYYLGGYISNKVKSPLALFTILMVGGFWAMFAPLIGTSIMRQFEPLGVQWAAFCSILLILFPSVSCMGMVSPIIIQFINKSKADTGRSAGKIYAISTIGGILATLFAGFWLIPTMGIKSSSFMVGGLLFFIGFIYMMPRKKLVTLLSSVIALLIIILFYPKPKNSESIEIKYNKVGLLGEWTVVDYLVEYNPQDNTKKIERNLLLNGIDQTKSQVGFEPLSLWSYPHKLGAYSSIKPAGSEALLLGMGGGSIAHELVSMGHNLDIVELDANAIPIARKYFNYDDTKSTIFIDDARHFVNQCQKKYDVIVIDVLQGEVQAGACIFN